MATNPVSALATGLADGAVRVIDLTQPLSENTPVLILPPPFANTPGLSRVDISRYDERGPAWYWNNISFGEHTGTHFDAPVHWITGRDLPDAATDSLPARSFIAPACVVDCSAQAARDADFLLGVDRLRAWEVQHGRIPEGSVVFVRSDWSKDWPDPALATRRPFPGVSLAALRFLHEQRHILFHGHEPLDTDGTPTLEGEGWLLRNGYTQAEGVAHLDQVPESGALVAIGFAKFRGGKLFEASKKQHAPGWTVGDQFADPKFVDLDKGDLRLTRTSPAVDAGVEIPKEWFDPLRKADQDRPDVGALPLGAEMLKVGPR